MPLLENNLITLKSRINSASSQAKRALDNVSLAAVSKTRSIEEIQSVYNLGLKIFAENYVHEAEQKIAQLPEDITWHFIGPIQSNKTRLIAEHFDWVQSIDRLKIIHRLNQQRPSYNPPLQCLVQINISHEPQKAGVTAEQARTLALAIKESAHLEFRGLMCIAKANENTQNLAQMFANMRRLFEDLQDIDARVDTLSMGMSQDMECAIKEGSTMIRIGTDLFGPRC